MREKTVLIITGRFAPLKRVGRIQERLDFGYLCHQDKA